MCSCVSVRAYECVCIVLLLKALLLADRIAFCLPSPVAAQKSTTTTITNCISNNKKNTNSDNYSNNNNNNNKIINYFFLFCFSFFSLRVTRSAAQYKQLRGSTANRRLTLPARAAGCGSGFSDSTRLGSARFGSARRSLSLVAREAQQAYA